MSRKLEPGRCAVCGCPMARPPLGTIHAAASLTSGVRFWLQGHLFEYMPGVQAVANTAMPEAGESGWHFIKALCQSHVDQKDPDDPRSPMGAFQ